eukprot:746677-Hanusia_phi.AAC.2
MEERDWSVWLAERVSTSWTGGDLPESPAPHTPHDIMYLLLLLLSLPVSSSSLSSSIADWLICVGQLIGFLRR